MSEITGAAVNDQSLDVLFREARTFSAWLPKPIAPEVLKKVYELARFGPTSANSSPARYVFVQSEAAKARLLPCLAPLNVEKSKAAPVTTIIAWDTEFYEHLPRLFPHADMKAYFVGKPAFIEENGLRNGSLGGAYFIMAARAMGLDCGPMSGFDQVKVNAEFFPEGKWKANFLCNLGYGDRSKLYPRSPRLEFEDACQVL